MQNYHWRPSSFEDHHLTHTIVFAILMINYRLKNLINKRAFWLNTFIYYYMTGSIDVTAISNLRIKGDSWELTFPNPRLRIWPGHNK